MATNGRERMGDVSELLLLVGERLAEAAYRVRVEAIKATRIGRVRMEMAMLRRERRAALIRLGEAALEVVREGRVTDPVLVARAREVEDLSATLEAKANEASRIADLSDEEILERDRPREPGFPSARRPTAAAAGDAPAGDTAGTRDGGGEPPPIVPPGATPPAL
ncbi:MAG TPA: hypothetical protein VIM86_14545 [Thermodesulfobacteriota bacterium]